MPVSTAVSPDGSNVYVASQESDAVAILDRDRESGALTQPRRAPGCVSATGTNGACLKGRALLAPTGVAVSPDGRNVYLSSQDSGAVAIFDRDSTTGALTQKQGSAGCVSEKGPAGCQAGEALKYPRAVAVSPDGHSVYVASGGSNAVAVFDRDPATGALTQKRGVDGCISGSGSEGACRKGKGLGFPFALAVSPDGKNVYVAAPESGAVAILDRDPDTGVLVQSQGTGSCISENGTRGACHDGKALKEPEDVAVSPDGTGVYVASDASNAVAIFDRDLKTGALAQKHGVAGCISEAGTGGACRDGRGLEGASAVAVSPDGRRVYAIGRYLNAVTSFDRRQRTGALTQKRGTAGCISDYEQKGACLRTVTLLGLPPDLTVSPDGKQVYVTSAIYEGVILTFDRSPATGTLSTRVEGSN